MYSTSYRNKWEYGRLGNIGLNYESGKPWTAIGALIIDNKPEDHGEWQLYMGWLRSTLYF